MSEMPFSLSYAVHTALGIPGKSELTVSSTSRSWHKALNVLHAPRPQVAKIWGVPELGKMTKILESSTGSSDSSSSAITGPSSGCGRKYACGKGTAGVAMPKDG